MNKVWLAILLWLGGIGGAEAMEKLSPKYHVRYGSENAPVQVIEYFSLSCAKCLELFETEFPSIQKELIETGELSWTFHPDPADLPTLQAMVCLEMLSDEKKRLFLEALLPQVAKWKRPHACEIMQAIMEEMGKPLPELNRMEFLETTVAFVEAYQFLRQDDVVTIIPTIEIDGNISESYPSRETVNELLAQKRST